MKQGAVDITGVGITLRDIRSLKGYIGIVSLVALDKSFVISDREGYIGKKTLFNCAAAGEAAAVGRVELSMRGGGKRSLKLVT